MFFYLYNEVAFLALDSVQPITHAVGNTVKRVVVILASVVRFKQLGGCTFLHASVGCTLRTTAC